MRTEILDRGRHGVDMGTEILTRNKHENGKFVLTKKISKKVDMGTEVLTRNKHENGKFVLTKKISKNGIEKNDSNLCSNEIKEIMYNSY